MLLKTVFADNIFFVSQGAHEPLRSFQALTAPLPLLRSPGAHLKRMPTTPYNLAQLLLALLTQIKSGSKLNAIAILL